MADWRERVERGFESFAAGVYRRPWWTIAAVLVLFAATASGIPALRIDTSNEAFFHEDDPTLVTYRAFRAQFGRDDIVVIAVEPDALFTRPALDRLAALHDDLTDNVPNLFEITSMVNARDTYGAGDTLVVDDLLARRPETPAALAALRDRVMANPLYRNTLVSADGRVTTIVLELDAFANPGASPGAGADDDALAGFADADAADDTEPVFLSDADNQAAVAAIQQIVARHEAPDFRLRVAGMPTVIEALKQALMADMSLFLRLAVASIAICLFLLYRRVTGVLFPLAVVALSLASTLGLMGHFGTAIKVPTVILPSFLLAVGVGASVHVLAIFYRTLDRTRDRAAALTGALGHSGLAIVMTSLTTAAGLGSFAFAEIAPVADLGLYSSAGVLLSLVYTVVLLPALFAVVPVKPRLRAGARGAAAFDRFLHRLADFSTRHAVAVVVAGGLLMAGFAVAAAQMRFSHDVLAWLPDDWPVTRATRAIDRDLKGSVVLELLLDTGRENGLHDREALVRLDRLARELEALDLDVQGQDDLFIGKATSITDMLKEINRALNGGRAEAYRVPDNPRLIPQEFLLFENAGSDDLENVTDSRFQVARFTIRVPWRDTLVYVPLIAEVEARVRAAFGDDVRITVTGVMTLFAQTLAAAIRSAAQSYVIAFVVITVMMMGLIGSVRIGLIAMLPNLAPIVVVMGLMWLAGLPLNMFTMLVGSIAIGLAVDDTIHFVHNFRRYYGRTGDVREAVFATFDSAGRAMLVTTVVLALGFYIFLFATLSNVVDFGLLTGTAILLALVADFLMAPALMALAHRGDGRAAPNEEADQ